MNVVDVPSWVKRKRFGHECNVLRAAREIIKVRTIQLRTYYSIRPRAHVCVCGEGGGGYRYLNESSQLSYEMVSLDLLWLKIIQVKFWFRCKLDWMVPIYLFEKTKGKKQKKTFFSIYFAKSHAYLQRCSSSPLLQSSSSLVFLLFPSLFLSSVTRTLSW